jgi:hypothetical protein
MISARFDPKLFFQRAENVALHVPAGEIFSLLKRRLDLPAAWAALITRASGDHDVVRPGGLIEGDGVDTVLFVRATPVELSVNEDQLKSEDGFTCHADVRLRLSVNTERSDLLLFTKALLGSRRFVQADALGRYLQPVLRDALARVAAALSAESLLESESDQSAAAALAEALQPPCFAGGLTLESRPVVRFQSNAAQEVRRTREAALRRKAEHEASSDLRRAIEQSQHQHLDHLTTVLRQLREMANDAPQVALLDLLRSFSEEQRGALYQALFSAEVPSCRTRWLVVAAGEELLYFKPGDYDQPARRIKVNGSAGPIRSIQANTDQESENLWLGGLTGLYRLPVDQDEPDLTMLVPQPPKVRGGFNAVAVYGSSVVGSHSEMGLWHWDARNPATAIPLFHEITRDAKAVRNVQYRDGRYFASIDNRVIAWPADGGREPTGLAANDPEQPTQIYTGSRSTLTALAITEDGVFAGNSDGDVFFWRTSETERPERLHTGSRRPVESIKLLDSHGLRRLFFTDTSPRVYAHVVGDGFSCGYEAGGQTIRRVNVAADLIVATNDPRDRLFIWKPGEPDHPIATINIGALTGRSIQDVCLVREG